MRVRACGCVCVHLCECNRLVLALSHGVSLLPITALCRSVVAAYVERAIERAEDAGTAGSIKPVSMTTPDAESCSSAREGRAARRYVERCLLKKVQAQIKERGPGGAVLTLLLRLRQCCCHLGLLTQVSGEIPYRLNAVALVS